MEEAKAKEDEIQNLERQAAERERRIGELKRDVEELTVQVKFVSSSLLYMLHK